MSECKVSRGHPLHGPYHDLEYGFPASDEATLFGLLALKLNQTGLLGTFGAAIPEATGRATHQ